ncbi:MAG: hypothetical protein HY589_02835, partial [Candidatus Omnitrophica bacterium]|nr:hypothetical protein [Candidatus Omnitrophota bacterium]
MDISQRPKAQTIIAVLLILFFAAGLRVHTFYLPHSNGDQVFYLGLAMKLEKYGLRGYNLKGIDLFNNGDILLVADSKDGRKGRLLEGLERTGVFYYSKEPLSNMPPLFSYLLMASRRIFGPREGFFTVEKNLGPAVIFFRPGLFLKAQFYAVWI